MKKKWPLVVLLLSANLALSGCFAVLALAGTATTASVYHDRRTAGTIVDDKLIQMKAASEIKRVAPKDEGFEHNVSVFSYNNNVLLVGQVPSEELKHEMETAIRDLPKVRRIYNEIETVASTSTLTRSSDAWITTKVKSNLLFDKKVDSTRIKVTTEDGVVYLLGLVTTAEEQAATEVARHISGVKKVVTLFEYVEDDEKNA